MFSYTDISLNEFPGEVSLVINSPSCNCHCPWCFNPDLLKYKPLSYKQMKDAVDEHRDFVSAVVLSGGEPLLNPYLKKILKYISNNGLKIKLNTNGLVSKNVKKNWNVGYLDYINVSLKGLGNHYQDVLNKEPFDSLSLHCNILEYSFVYSSTIWPKPYLNNFYNFLNSKIKRDWRSVYSNTKWTQPDIFTVVQMQTGDCLDKRYNSCLVPTEQECIKVAKMFTNIPLKSLIVETNENGRNNINI